MKKIIDSKKGISILGIIFFSFLVILVLGYFKISIRTVIENPETQDNLEYVGGGTVSLWEKYFRKPALYFWKDIWVDIFWEGFIDNMKRLRDGDPSEIEEEVPTVSS